MLSSQFTRESHLAKMNAALKKEFLLHELLAPRARQCVEMDGESTHDGCARARARRGVRVLPPAAL